MVVVAAAGALLTLTQLPERSNAPKSGPVAPDGTATARVTRGTISVQQQVTGTVGYVGSYGVVNQMEGIYTSLPSAGAVIGDGQLLYRVGSASSTSPGTLLTAEAQLASDEASLHALLTPTLPTKAEIQAAQAKASADQQRIGVDQQRITVDEAQIESLIVTSPIAGQISTVDVSPGQSVGEGQTLFQVVNPATVTVVANFLSMDLQNAFVGERAQVAILGFGTLTAYITSIGVMPSGQYRGDALYPVTLAVASPPAGLRSGMPATVSIVSAYTSAQGTVQFSDTLDVTAAASGTIGAVDAVPGTTVQNGATVVTIASPGLQTQLAGDKSQLASDESQLAGDQSALYALQHPTPPSSGQVASLKARVAADRAVVSEAQQAFTSSDQPVVLLYGGTPSYRTLQEGDSGPDVQELNASLVGLGYASRAQLSPSSRYYGAVTAAAVQHLQANFEAPETGTLPLGEAVFLPTSLRVTSVTPSLGGSAAPGQSVLSATSGTPDVVAQIDATLQSAVKPGQSVEITLPDQRVIGGRVTSVVEAPASGSNGNSGSDTTATNVYVAPDRPSALSLLDGATVEVTVTVGSVRNVLTVPVTALLAQPGGGYAVEVVGPGEKRHLLPVQVGLFDDASGLVQVSGAGLVEGMKLTVAGS